MAKSTYLVTDQLIDICFHFLATVNSASMNICVQIFA